LPSTAPSFSLDERSPQYGDGPLVALRSTERRTIPGLPANRADVIIMGVAIYEAVLQHFQLPELYVSTRGLRFGALLDMP
jgi:exopolyphosphatase/pppGpp-phosphohydrolase